jgi:hypothetical protein
MGVIYTYITYININKMILYQNICFLNAIMSDYIKTIIVLTGNLVYLDQESNDFFQI